MKKVFKSFLVIIAAMVAFAGCVKQEIEAPTASELKIVQFFAESIETKTAFGTPDGTSYPTLWTANDKKIKLALNGNSASDVEVEVSSDYKTAKFEASFDENTTESCKFYALSPSTVYNNMSSSVISANIWESQTPSETSVDEAAQVLYAVSSEYSSLPSSISMNFKHFTAYGLLTLSNLNLNGAVVSSVAITASKNFAGRWNYEVANDRFVENSGSATITLHTSRTEGLWFACAPVDMSGQTLSVTVNTDKGTITRTVTLPADRKFEAGKISRFTIDMSSAVSDGPKVYELLTDIANLTVGSKVIIAAASTTSNYAISSTQNNNNRAGAAATKTGTTIVDPSESVEIFEVEEGTDTGTYAFKATKYEGYIYAAGGTGSNNYMRTQSSKELVTSWTVNIASDGKATIVCAKSDVARNTIRFKFYFTRCVPYCVSIF